MAIATNNSITFREPRAFSFKKKNDLRTVELLMYIEENYNACASYANFLLETGWQIVACDVDRGVCYESDRVIIIPSRVITSRREGYMHYYLAHELAHAKAGCKAKHGPLFMEAFKSLCDKEHWHYETEYKPSHALYAGIVPEDF